MPETSILAAINLHNDVAEARVVQEAIKLAQTHDERIELVFVIPDQQDGYAQHFVPEELRACGGRVLRGTVCERIVARTDEIGASFIVIGANKPTIRDLFIGPNAARVARDRDTNCSVLTVRP
ncbi:Universal stress protein family protein [Cribrihabitans marinus]|uniref:Universal stress protein family protein n=1 Tax=Cribrihabitans marinus TaxID=1227549 RepID=A0A1H7DQ32_9RHOB|nr:universal stress protein [Cribrihabitans marinus]SEK03494.1 Universal stress protein family protein [Cribrihabitans marinus]